MNNRLTQSLVLAIITVFGIIVGFIRDLVLSNFYGASIYSDIYLVLLNIPIIIFASIGSAINTSYLPLYSRIVEKDGHKKGITFTNKIMNVIILGCIIFVSIVYLFPTFFIKLFAVGFTGETLILASKLTKIIILSLVFIGPSYLLTAYLNFNLSFLLPASVTILTNIGIILFIISSNGNIEILVWGTVISFFFQPLILIIAANKKQYKMRLDFNYRDQNLISLFKLVIPVLLGTAVGQINEIVDRSLASMMGEGVLSCFTYANRISSSIQILFVSSIITIIYPLMNKYCSKNKNKEFKGIVELAIRFLIIFVLPCATILFTLSESIIKLLFERGSFTSESTLMTSNILKIYVIGVIFWTVREILSKSFYALGNTITPTLNSTVAVILNIILNIIFAKIWGYIGLAYASMLTALFVSVLLFISLHKKINFKLEKKYIKDIIFLIIITIVLSILIKITQQFLLHSNIVLIFNLIISSIIGIIFYGIAVVYLNIFNIKKMIKDFKKY